LADLAPLAAEAFAAALTAALAAQGSPPPGAEALAALHRHHAELVRWAATIDLVGPAAAGELIERHYAESLAALDWLPGAPFRLADLGSGAGFPGLVLAAARPDAEVWLVEPRERRAAFLAAAARKMGSGARVVGARVGGNPEPPLPDNLEIVTVRALRLGAREIGSLLPRLAAGGRLLAWGGGEPPELPPELELERERLLPGSRQRYLRSFRRAEATA